MAVSKRLRYEVLRRDNFTCRYCGSAAGETGLEVDHVIPASLGGEDKPANLVTACVDCNRGKSSSSPDAPIVENVSDDALRWGAAMDRAAEIQAEERAALREFIAGFDQAWKSWRFIRENDLPEDEKTEMPRPGHWKTSIEHFFNAKLTPDDLVHFVEVTMTRPNIRTDSLWRYFCGCCWNLIRERQSIAAGLLAVEDEGEMV